MKLMKSQNRNYPYSKLDKESGTDRRDLQRDTVVIVLSCLEGTILYLLKIIALSVPITALLIFLSCYGCTLQNSTSKDYANNDDQTAPTSPQCSSISVYQRTDCLPQGGATQQACTTAECCWGPVEVQNAPPCFYPNNYKGYFVQSHIAIPAGTSYTLVRNTSSGWPNDVKILQLDVIYERSTRLHFKIYDPTNKRYEVPIEVSSGGDREQVMANYIVTVPTSGPFSLTVKRQGSGNVLFETGTIPLIFSDQYIQLGTLLETNLTYGLDEHLSQFLLKTNWTKLAMWTRDQPPMPNYNLYGQHPFFLNVEPNQDVHGVFLLNSNAMEVELQPYPAVTYRTTGGILDFYVLSGPVADDVMDQYTDLIGRPFMPPYWALGFNLCRWGYGGTSGLRKVIDRMRAANMPYDPGISNTQPTGNYPPFDEGLKHDIFIKNPNGSGPIIGVVWPGNTAFPDFFHPNATLYWTDQSQGYYQKVQFDGLWIDMNEPSNFFDGSVSGCPDNSLENPPFIPTGLADGKLRSRTLCASARQFLSTHYNLHSLYGYSETKASMSALRSLLPNKRSLVLTRSTFPGSGVYGGHWLGDNNAEWEDMVYSIPGVLNFQLFGIPLVGADICGFFGDTNPELCIRWMQLGAFYPFMRNHNAVGFKDQDPASFDESTQAIMRTALETRYSLLPFLYTLFYYCVFDGSPPVRPLFFNYPYTNRTAIYGIDKQFMWSNSLLITPALDPNITTGEGYLPEGRWYDFYNHTFVDSPGRFTTFDMPLDRINIQVFGGTVFPIQKPEVTTTLSRKNEFAVYAALDKDGSAYGELYWDDGESLDSIEGNKFNLISFLVEERQLKTYVQNDGYRAEPMILDTVYILGVDIGPTAVLVNGKPTSQYTYSGQTLTVYGLSADLLRDLNIRWTI